LEQLDLEVGLKLKKLREEMGLTLREVGKRIEIDHSYIAKIEKGKMPSLEKLKKLCSLYGVTVSSLFGEEVGMPEELKELGVDWIRTARNMSEKGLTPEEVEKMVEIVRALKNL
jgi:transcriptional regulator with XRE-family HTH domain